ncbi:MAG TPA: ABC transporter substrate-binding protein, partial [Reyranella sp.]
MLKLGRRFACALVAAAAFAAPAYAQTTLKVALHSDLKIIDPIWTTALISTHHGNMVYDTLFALDDKLEVKPQMVDKWQVSPDKLTWTFTLRDGLKWHDGTPVTSADVTASIKRWTDKDTIGGLLARFTREMKAVDDKTFEIALKEPLGIMLSALARS